jgi:hypothetical protein
MKPDTQAVKERKQRQREALGRRRHRELRESGATKAAVQRFAKVSESMVYLWYRGLRTSQRVQAAHDAVTIVARANRTAS